MRVLFRSDDVGGGSFRHTERVRNAVEPFVKEHAQLAPRQMGTQADMHAARQREMAVVLARGIEPVRAFELVRVEIARGVEDADPIAGLAMDPLPFDVGLHLPPRSHERVRSREFPAPRIKEPLYPP